MTGSGRGDRETAQEIERTECAVCGKAGYWPHRFDATQPAHSYKPVTVRYVRAARSRAEVAAEIAEALREAAAFEYCQDHHRAGDTFTIAADFIEQRFVSVRPDNEEAKRDA